jgi:polysaccharide chain length determinant protein (PEP-CTERM system associated)
MTMDDTFEGSPVRWQDYWAMVMRRRWWLMAPLFVCGFVAFGVAHFWPEKYRSEALILVEQQKVPELYVTPNVVTDLQDRLQSMTQQILSRTRLQKLIEQSGLYAEMRQHMTSDEIVDKMRTDIRIELVQAPRRQDELTAFRISFMYSSPHVAQQITNELTSLFIDENLQARGQQSVGTTSFLENQLEQARQDLAQQEQSLREYKLRFIGELPEQQQSMLQMLGSLQSQLEANSAAIERSEHERIYLESMRSEYQALQGSGVSADGNAAVSPIAAADETLRDLRKQLTDLESKYTLRHPDVEKLQDEIADWEQQRKQLEDKRDDPTPKDASTNPVKTPRSMSLVEVESRLKVTKAEIEDYQESGKKLRARMDDLEKRLNLVPMREQQLAEVNRNYENSRQNYQSLLQKKMQSELATNLEKRQQGEQFRIIDPPNLPLKPSEPNRLEIIAIGWVLGICIGVGLTALQEMRDESIHSERALHEFVPLAILVHVPPLRSRSERIRTLLLRACEVMATAVLLLSSIALGVYTYLAG